MMEGWKEYKIGNLILKSKQRDPRKEPEEYFMYVDVSSVSRERYSIADYTITKGEDAPSRARKIIQKDDVIFATVRPTLMRIALVPKEFHNEICSTGYCVLKPNKELIIPAFLYYSVLPDYFISKIGRLQRGASYPAIRDTDLKNQLINVPPLPEQHKIAYVLSTVQKAIEQQDKLIRAATELKKALMQKLFTEGTGWLSGVETSQKQTEIGLVPESWEVVELGEYLEKTKLKDPTKTPDEKYIYVDVSSVDNELLKVTDVKRILGKDAPSRARKLIQTDDIIFATVRPTLKRIAKITEDLNNQICSTGYCVLKPVKTEIEPEFLYQYLQFDNFISRIAKLQRGASYPAVRDKDVKGMKIPLPGYDEQVEIAEIFKTLDKKVSVALSKKQTLSDLFKTLLHELMTGQRRVHEIDFENKKEELLMAAEPEMKYNE